ncbi:MAG TPA: sulfur carrier protein ThiS [Thermodesulfovibrionales bacterium]|nr:sulfur carrier protein ThiS [Thermodesulfovibrionales bacterium]
MKVMVNGEEYITDIDTVAELLREMKVTPGRVAVEVNLAIIKRADFEKVRLRDGDSVEIVNFVGGGKGSRW